MIKQTRQIKMTAKSVTDRTGKSKADHYYTKDPTSLERRKTIDFEFARLNIGEKSRNNVATSGIDKFIFTTSSGVFSKDKPDLGSIVLVKAVMPVGRVLDLGCGYGFVGIVLKKNYPILEMTCSDINSRAVGLTIENAKLNNVEIMVIQSDIFDNLPGEFDTIIINLPLNAGKDICNRMIEQSYVHLAVKGTLQVVSRHKKGGKQFEIKMEEIFGNCGYLSKESGYRVYISTKELNLNSEQES